MMFSSSIHLLTNNKISIASAQKQHNYHYSEEG
jgi:hypothetical protein